MTRQVSISALATGAILLFLSSAACAGSVNKSIKVGAGEQSGGESTVNGSISVGTGATVSGSLSTVNGTIRVDDDVQLGDAETVNGALRLGSGVTAENVETVNGSIRVGDRSRVDGRINAVNGRIEAGAGTGVGRNVENVNGEIELNGAEIGGDIKTVNGDVRLNEGAVVMGNIVIEKPSMWSFGQKSRKPKVIIGPGSRVDGEIVAEREIELYISESAQVGGVSGKMQMDDAMRFSGDRP